MNDAPPATENLSLLAFTKANDARTILAAKHDAFALTVDVGTALAFGPTGGGGAFYPFGPFIAGPQPGPGPGPWTGLQARVAFTLSGGSDTAVLTGRAEILEIPEPTSIALAALMAAGALAYRRR